MKKTNQIGGKTYPELDFPENEKIIRGFNWRESERPISKLDLFKDDPPLVLKVIKGLDSYIPPVEFFDSSAEMYCECATKSLSKTVVPAIIFSSL